MENTTFAILSPDGKSKLTKAGRAPFHAFRGSGGMATGMAAIAAQYPATKTPFRAKRLPLMKNLDLALNVAAADSLPLVVSVGGKEQRERLNQKPNTAAWDESLAGQFIYATAEPKELKPITGAQQTMSSTQTKTASSTAKSSPSSPPILFSVAKHGTGDLPAATERARRVVRHRDRGASSSWRIVLDLQGLPVS